MCTLADIQTYNNNTAKVADIKKDYILNIIAACNSCTAIKKVVLFGSSTSENCKQSSDIDIAVFGNKTKAQIFKSKSYRNFINKICSFGHLQDYDILYFQTNKQDDTAILSDIANGITLFERS